jgi:hypothetical protein
LTAKDGKALDPKAVAAAELAELFDRIHSREFKILLAPEAFSDVERDVREYWRLARSVARRQSAIVSEGRAASVPQLREVTFLDTPAAELHRHSHALRKRARYAHGSPRLEFELSLEFRSRDVRRAVEANVQAAAQYEGVEDLKEEIFLASDAPTGLQSAFSHSCRLKEHRWELGTRFSDATRIFSGLAELRIMPTAMLRTVGEIRVEELLFELGEIDFGGHEARVRMSVWRDGGNQRVLTGEFAFETHFLRYGRVPPQAKLRSERFFRLLHEETSAPVDLGHTRTDLLYELAGVKGPHRE